MKNNTEVFKISVQGSEISFSCGGGEYLLAAMRRSGRFKSGDCRGGGCGICKVRVVSGAVSCDAMSREHVTAREEAYGFVLACRARPRSDLVIEKFHF